MSSVPAENASGIVGYTARELRRVLREIAGVTSDAAVAAATGGARVVLGTADAPDVRRLLAAGFVPAPTHQQGYAMRAGADPDDSRRTVLALVGADAAGALYALRDLEHYEREHLSRDADGRLAVTPFARADHPRIEYRGHWVWGCNMPDKPAWLDAMSRWKLNELIHWDNYPPARAAEYVALAHERGIRVVWGFGWGWVPAWNFTLPPEFDRGVGQGVELCASSEFNQAFFRREIPRKVRELYAPTGCDGIYFQAFTECPKCQCPRCAPRTMGELMLRFVNPIVDDLAREFPRLWIACGIHADFGTYDHLRDLDPRCSIIWENCGAGTSVRGPDEDFGYIYKSIPYGHGFGKDCPADPPYTEASLRAWVAETAARYAVPGGLETHRQYLHHLQGWARRFLAKPSPRKHASVVADHSVFCRRTPFPHVALAEAQWNPDGDVAATVDGILAALCTRAAVAATLEPATPLRDPAGLPPWLVPAATAAREGHDR